MIPLLVANNAASSPGFAGVDAKNNDVIAELVGHPLHRRHFRNTRKTPGRPEIEHDGLAA